MVDREDLTYNALSHKIPHVSLMSICYIIELLLIAEIKYIPNKSNGKDTTDSHYQEYSAFEKVERFSIEKVEQG